MATSKRDRISVDLRGLKAALIERATARRLTPSAFIRGVLIDALGRDVAAGTTGGEVPQLTMEDDHRVRLSMRIQRQHAVAIGQAAQRSGLSSGDYVAGLIDKVPVLSSAGSRSECLTALRSSCAELSTLSRNVHRMTNLLRQGQVEAARPYRALLDSLAAEVRGHLEVAAAVLASVRPARR